MRPLMWPVLFSLLAGVVLTFAGAWHIGTYLDEGYHVEFFSHYLQSGWFHSEYSPANDGSLQPAGTGAAHIYVYGPVSMILLHGFVALLGAEPWSAATMTAEAIAVRHIGVALIAMVGLLTVILLGRAITASWRWGLAAGALLVATPVWTGHAMMNVKDIPVAVGFTVFTLGLVTALRLDTVSRSARATGPTLIAVGLLLAVGDRIGIWPGLVASAAGTVVLSWAGVEEHGDMGRWAAVRRVSVRVVVGMSLGVAALAAVYPAIFRDPLQALVGSVTESSNFLGTTPSSRSYIPLHVLLDLPVLVVILGAIGIVGVLRAVFVGRGRTDLATAGAVVVALQMTVLPALAVVKGADLYDGLRHLLFALPPLAVLSMLGWRSAVARAALRGQRTRTLVRAGVVVGLLVPLLAEVQLFPYGYAYTNALATTAGVDPPTDYWRTSFQELVPSLPRGVPVTCAPYTVDGQATRWSFDGVNDCATNPLLPVHPYADLRAPGPPEGVDPEDFYALVRGDHNVAPNCHREAEISRRLLWSTVTMSTLVRCHLAYPTLSPDGFSVATTVGSLALLVDGWTRLDALGGIRASGDVATIAFHVAPSAPGRVVRLSGVVRAGSSATVTAAWGEPGAVPAASSTIGKAGETFSLAVPTTTAQDLVFLSFRSTDGSPLELRLISVRAVPGS